MITRRKALAGMAATLGGALSGPVRAQDLSATLAALEAQSDGQLSLLLRDTGSGQDWGYNDRARVPLSSTFKLLLTGLVLRRVDMGAESLARVLPIAAEDIVPWSPTTERYVGHSLSVKELCRAAMQHSDNTAGNLLLGTIGGPEGLTEALRTLGDPVTRLDRWEVALNDVPPGEIRDTTTAQAMIAHLDRFLLGDLLSATGRKTLLTWMLGNRTGAGRIRAGASAGWQVGDKTGTTPHGAYADIALLRKPDRAPLLLAIYLRDSPLNNAQGSAIIAQATGLVLQQIG